MRILFAILLLWFAGLGAAAQFAKIAVPFGQMRNLYPEVGAELGWLLSLISLLGAAFGVVAGSVVGNLGARRVLLGGLFLGGLLSFWQASFPAFPLMLLTRLGEGASHLAIVVAAPTLIAQISPDRFRGMAMTLWSTFFGVSFALVAWVVLPLTGSLEILFIAHGGFMLAIAAAVPLLVAEPETRVAGESWNTELAQRHWRAYQSPHISAPGAGWLFYTLTFVSLLAILPERLPVEHRAMAVGLMPLLGIATSLLLVSALLRQMGSIPIVILGFGLSLGIVLLNLISDQQLVLAILLFAALGLVQGASFASVPELNHTLPDQALAYGLLAQTGNLGNLLGTPILLAVAGMGGDVSLFLAIALIYAAAICAHLLLARRRKTLET